MPSRRLVRSHGTVLLIVVYVTASFEHSPIGGRPIESAIVIFFSCGFALLYFQDWLSNIFIQAAAEHEASAAEKNTGEATPSGRRWSSLFRLVKIALAIPASARRNTVLPLAVAVCLRVWLLGFACSEGKCVSTALHGYLPLLLAVYAFMKPRHDADRERQGPLGLRTDHDEWGMPAPPERASLTPPVYLLCSLILAVAMTLKPWVIAATSSTYICPHDTISRIINFLVPTMSLILDFYLIVKLEAMLKGSPNEERSQVQSGNIVAAVLVLASEVLAVVGGVNVVLHPTAWRNFFQFDASFPTSLIGYICISGLFVIAAISIISHMGAFHFSFLVTSITVYTITLKATTSLNDLAASISTWKLALFLIALHVAIESYVRLSSAFGLLRPTKSARPSPRIYTTLISLFLASLSLLCWFSWRKQLYYGHHPLDDIIDEGMIRSQKWLAQASQGMSLDISIENYNKRHGRPPPPGFDNWYRYATQRSSYIVDDFDNLYEDLRPFWGIQPAEIRQLTEQATSHTGNGIAKIEIRDGQAKPASNAGPENVWLTEGFISMTSQFIKHIPDMDLALNLNKGPRVAVPHATLKTYLDHASNVVPSNNTNFKWSSNRAESWKHEGLYKVSKPFSNLEGVNSFSASTVGCQSSSPARKHHDWDSTASCSSCQSHSTAGIVRNWTLALSPCHQPDLRTLHGFYSSPATAQISHRLLPIFSQSKISGFADILFPSPWDYLNKTAYSPNSADFPDPPFAKKRGSLFWRGTTTEGTSHSGLWKGMLRQRLVHIAGKLPLRSRSPEMPMLLPDYYTESRYSIQYPEISYKHVTPTLNISFTGIDYATNSDKVAQTAHFGVSPPVDFQEHWRHRYLFVTDGAGISNDFIPFMHSNSIPFRSGIFKAWYDGRLTAWAHFVPIDVRLTGLFSTLAYFAGTDGTKGAKTLKGRVGMEKREKVAESIAENGRDWAQKVLRKEDMEIYLFRLLLEWGRITDDKRDELGLVV